MVFAVQRFFHRVIAGVATFVMTVVALVAIPTTSAQASTACSTTGATSSYGGGSGTSAAPYLISTPQQLAYLSATTGDWGKHFRQTANIDLGNCKWTPIGGRFTGSYDGDFFSITGLLIDIPASPTTSNRQGLFGALTNATIRDLVLEGTISAPGATAEVGGLVGKVEGTTTIENVKVKVNISAGASTVGVGGIAGVGDDSRSTISYSSYRGNLSSSYSSGGIAGRWIGAISNSYAIATITVTSGTNNAGGILGSITPAGNKLINSLAVTNAPYGLSGGDVAMGETGSTGSFWNKDLGPTTQAARTNPQPMLAYGQTTAELKQSSTYSAKSWAIVEGWEPFSAPTKIWGICGSDVNDGYPFLLWEYASNPCPSSNDASGSAEGRALSPAIHLDLKANVGDQISGRPVEIAGTGVGGGSAYSLVVRSAPTTITSGSASGMGNFSNTLRMPALPAGTHTLTLKASAPDGSALTLTQTFTVSAAGVVTSMSDPIGKVGKTLAETGSDPQSAMWGWGVALLLIAAGVLMRTTRKRFAL